MYPTLDLGRNLLEYVANLLIQRGYVGRGQFLKVVSGEGRHKILNLKVLKSSLRKKCDEFLVFTTVGLFLKNFI